MEVVFRFVVVAILGVHITLVAVGAGVHSPGWDEWGHLPGGLSHWYTGHFHYYRVNPPLVRMIAAIPILLCGVRFDCPPVSADARERPEWECAQRMVKVAGERIFWYFTLARWACIPFTFLGAVTCFCWASELYGKWSGLLALTLWSFSPAILGNAQMVTPDTGAAALGVTASYLFWRWLRASTVSRAVCAGVALGLAELAKFTWIVLFVLWPVLWITWGAYRNRTSLGEYRRGIAQGVLILGLGVYIINVGYAFEGTGRRLGEFRFVSRLLRSGNSTVERVGTSRPDNWFAGSWLASIRMPLPANYVQGIDRQKLDFEQRPWSYFRGEWRRGGWWYYYIYGLAIKEPLGTWVLVLFALVIGFFGRGYVAEWRDELMLLAPIAVVLTLVSSQTGFNHHIRYVLPIFPFGFIWVSKLARCVESGHRKVVASVGLALLWSVGSSLYHYPHSLSYFNELVGGPKNGHTHLLDSNIDWGQDLLFLKRWLQDHPEVQPIALAYSIPASLVDPVDFGIKYVQPPPGPNARLGHRLRPSAELGPLPGWYAIFVRPLRERDRKYAYFEHFEPVEMIGYTIRIYHISVDDANRVRRKLGLPEVGAGEAPKA